MAPTSIVVIEISFGRVDPVNKSRFGWTAGTLTDSIRLTAYTSIRTPNKERGDMKTNRDA